jgi:hypothetical protein
MTTASQATDPNFWKHISVVRDYLRPRHGWALKERMIKDLEFKNGDLSNVVEFMLQTRIL